MACQRNAPTDEQRRARHALSAGARSERFRQILPGQVRHRTEAVRATTSRRRRVPESGGVPTERRGRGRGSVRCPCAPTDGPDECRARDCRSLWVTGNRSRVWRRICEPLRPHRLIRSARRWARRQCTRDDRAACSSTRARSCCSSSISSRSCSRWMEYPRRSARTSSSCLRASCVPESCGSLPQCARISGTARTRLPSSSACPKAAVGSTCCLPDRPS